jgi:universal stress protein E
MKSLKKILLPMDFSGASMKVVDTACMVAKTYQSEIMLLHVIPEIAGSPVAMDALQRSALEQLSQVEAAIAAKLVGPVLKSVVAGSPFDQIIRHADAHDVNVILMGNGSKGAGDKYQLGVTAEKVIRKSSRPVWVVKEGTPATVDSIVCPVDFSPAAARALRNAVNLGHTFGAKLTILTVIENLSNVYPGRPLIDPEAQGSYALDQEREFERFGSDFDFSGLSWKKIVLHGVPHEEILRFARQAECRLMVLGSEGRTGLAKILLGSVAEKVVRELPCSVITVKAERLTE